MKEKSRNFGCAIKGYDMQIRFPFDKEKTLNVLLYMVSHLKRTDLHKVFKILYFSDRAYLREYGRPITGDMYVTMEAGLVPSKVYDICRIVRGDAYSQDEELKRWLGIEDWMYLVAKRPADEDKIAPNEREVIDACIREYGDLSYDEIKEKSHDIAWRSTARDYIIRVEDIAREAGLSSEELGYVADNAHLMNFAWQTKDLQQWIRKRL